MFFEIVHFNKIAFQNLIGFILIVLVIIIFWKDVFSCGKTLVFLTFRLKISLIMFFWHLASDETKVFNQLWSFLNLYFLRNRISILLCPWNCVLWKNVNGLVHGFITFSKDRKKILNFFNTWIEHCAWKTDNLQLFELMLKQKLKCFPIWIEPLLWIKVLKFIDYDVRILKQAEKFIFF